MYSTANMPKPEDQVIQEFNQYVNMTVPELEAWLQTEESTSAGWSKDDGSGESVGHESGRKIVQILKKNPEMDPGELRPTLSTYLPART